MRHSELRDVDRPRLGRSAFTIFELILVLAILVTIAALSWPQMMRFVRLQSVEGNAELVRQLLDHARIRAVEEGRVLQVRFEPGGSHYVLLPNDPFDDSDAAAGQEKSPPKAFQEPYRIQQMSGGCQFYAGSALLGETTASERLGQPWLGHLENGYAARDLSWTPPILYFPDGSATDGSTIIMDEDRNSITLWVRGLTGAVAASRVTRMPEVFGNASR